MFSSRLPSDPGIKVNVQRASLESKTIEKKSWFGLGKVEVDDAGQPITEVDRLFRGRNVFLEVADVPVFWLPYIQGDPNDPLGPLRNVNVGFSQMYGFRVGAAFNLFDLFNITPNPARTGAAR